MGEPLRPCPALSWGWGSARSYAELLLRLPLLPHPGAEGRTREDGGGRGRKGVGTGARDS